ncbi:MAG TPA: hypothetical protein DCQ30_13925 [Acidimicrobiaceae bacterium]|nr:hypothetical protein [Acidimicrobiaceae bacterium]
MAVGLACLGMAGLVTAACSSGRASPSVASLPGHAAASQASGPLSVARSDRLFVEFARCLRAHGINEPDPVHRPGHQGLSIEIPPPGPSTNAGLAACNHIIAPVAQMKQAHAQQQLASWLPGLTRYAECMRAHQIPMLDPGPMGQLNLGNVPGINNDFGRYSPQFRAADSTCRHLLPAGVHDGGTGP